MIEIFFSEPIIVGVVACSVYRSASSSTALL